MAHTLLHAEDCIAAKRAIGLDEARSTHTERKESCGIGKVQNCMCFRHTMSMLSLSAGAMRAALRQT